MEAHKCVVWSKRPSLSLHFDGGGVMAFPLGTAGVRKCHGQFCGTRINHAPYKWLAPLVLDWEFGTFECAFKRLYFKNQ